MMEEVQLKAKPEDFATPLLFTKLAKERQE